MVRSTSIENSVYYGDEVLLQNGSIGKKITNHEIIDNANVVKDINVVLELRSRKTVEQSIFKID